MDEDWIVDNFTLITEEELEEITVVDDENEESQ